MTIFSILLIWILSFTILFKFDGRIFVRAVVNLTDESDQNANVAHYIRLSSPRFSLNLLFYICNCNEKLVIRTIRDRVRDFLFDKSGLLNR